MNMSSASLLHRLDALSKLVALLCLSLLTIRVNEVMPSLIIFIGLFLLALLAANMDSKKLLRRFIFIFGFALPLFLLTMLAAPQGGASLQLGIVTLSTSAIADGFVVAMRMIILFTSSMLYIETTNPRQFLVMLTTYLKLPYRFVFGVSIALSFLPMLEEEARTAIAARKLRRGRAPRHLSEVIGVWKGSLLSIFTGAIRRIGVTAGAMDAKGFGAYATRTYSTIPRIQRAGYFVMMISVLSLGYFWVVL